MTRYWIHTSVVEDQPEVGMPFGEDTVGIVDEEEGGVILYLHKDHAEGILEALERDLAEAWREGYQAGYGDGYHTLYGHTDNPYE